MILIVINLHIQITDRSYSRPVLLCLLLLHSEERGCTKRESVIGDHRLRSRVFIDEI